jgi:hypothetical protein
MTDEPITEDWLMEFARAQQLEAWRKQHQDSAKCPACRHNEHGVVCSFTGTWTSCDCPSSYWGATA